MQAASARSDDQEEDRLIGEWMHDDSEVNDELKWLDSRRLTRKAGLLRLPVPSRDGDDGAQYWTRSELSGRYYLTDYGVRKVRAEIRAELKARDERLLAWLGLFVSAIVGVLGAITGLVAVARN
jgi:hypothetical protein